MSANEAASAGARPAALRASRDVLALLILTGLLWLVHVYGRVLPTAALGAAWIAATAAIAGGLFLRARLRRAALLAGYLRPESPLARHLRGGWFMALRQTVLAALLALLLLVALIRLADAEAWIMLIAAAPSLVLLQRLMRGLLARHASAAYLPELAWRCANVVTGLGMIGVLVWLALHRAYPDFAGVSLERAVWHLVDPERARSGWAETLLQIAATKDALRLWLAQQLMPQPGASFADALGWSIVVAEEALFVWSYLLLCSGTLIRLGGSRDGRSSGTA